MSEPGRVVRLAAKGDGITADGRHVAYAAPGDRLGEEGALVAGPHRVAPPCRHFGRCGGCRLQHCDEPTLADFVRQRVLGAALGQGLVPQTVGAPAMSPPASRRRVSLRMINGGGRALLGFSEAGSHRLVDLAQCPVLLPELLRAAFALRDHFRGRKGKYAFGIELTACDQGVDALLSGYLPEGLSETERLLDLCRRAPLARLSLDQGYGPEGFFEPEPVTITLGAVPVALPPGAFLQATAQGEAALVDAAREWLGACSRVADLFAGLGTFALALAPGRQVLAAEADQAAVLALRSAAARARLPLEASHRDLFRNPLRAAELAAFSAVVLDPPRAGARAQVEQIALSAVPVVVYVSCNPSSWARDGALLAAAGYRLAEVRPVGQFRWSTHVELASLFVR